MPNLEILAQHNRERLAKAKEQYLGKTFSSNNFGDFIVVDYVSSKNITVEFIATGYQTNTTTKEINQGKIADRLKPSVFGVGIIGNNCPTSINNKTLKVYKLWNSMIERCYSDNPKKAFTTYKNCTISDSFLHYEYFYNWCNKQIGFNCDNFDLDKDLLIKGNKVYSESACVFLPKEINLALSTKKSQRGDCLIGVRKTKTGYQSRCNIRGKNYSLGTFNTEIEAFNTYKQTKESYLKELANKWKDKIDARAYNALMNYQVEITD